MVLPNFLYFSCLYRPNTIKSVNNLLPDLIHKVMKNKIRQLSFTLQPDKIALAYQRFSFSMIIIALN
jgi:hypothetical protein